MFLFFIFVFLLYIKINRSCNSVTSQGMVKPYSGIKNIACGQGRLPEKLYLRFL